MKKLFALMIFLGICLPCATAAAQENSGTATENASMPPPPKVLSVFREFVKPGKSGPPHDRSESAFVQAMQKAKWPTHYLAVDSVTGKSRSLFLTGYDSFDAWEKDVMATEKNETLSAELSRDAVADGELLSDTDASAWAFNPDHSLRVPVDIPHMRYFDITVFHIKPGHDKDWDDIMKLVLDAYQKMPDVHWAAYDNVYGAANAHAFFLPMKSASEIDHNIASDKDFVAAMGEEGMKKLGELSSAAIDSIESNLFTFNPKMSYVSDEWIKADPSFWKPKAGGKAMAPKKPAEKPAEPAKP